MNCQQAPYVNYTYTQLPVHISWQISDSNKKYTIFNNILTNTIKKMIPAVTKTRTG